MNPRLKKFLRIVGICLVSFIALIFIAGFVVSKFFGDDIKRLAIKEINKQLVVPLDISEDDVHFSVLRNFPNASVTIENIKMRESFAGATGNVLEICLLYTSPSPRDA